MFRATTAETSNWFGASRVRMRGFTTLLTAGSLTAGGTAVTKSLTFETAERIGNENSDVFLEPADGDLLGEGGGVESQNEQTSVPSLTIAEGSQPSDVRDSLSSQV